MEFFALGPLQVACADQVFEITAPRQRIVLAALLLERDHVVSLNRLIDMLWPVDPPVTARTQVQYCVSELRRLCTVPDTPIRTAAPGYSLASANIAVDTDLFRALAEEGRAEAAAGRTELAAEKLRSALRLWRGEAFAGIDSPMIQAAAVQLEELRLTVTEELVDRELELGRHDAMVHRLTRLIAENPLRERLRCQQMLALYRAGRGVEALEAYRAARGVLVAELGIEPGPELRRMERAILAEDPALASPAGTERRGQLAVPRLVPRQLPADIVDLTGRREVLDELLAILTPRQHPTGRALIAVITGPAGVGKTTLAVRIGHVLAQAFPDGQLFAQLRGPGVEHGRTERVLEHLVRAFGMRAGLPDTTEELAKVFRSITADRRLFVLLDAAVTEDDVLPLIPAGSESVVLVTSRRRLTGLSGAHHVDLELLDPGSAENLLATAARRRELAVQDPSSTRSLLRLCGGLPLAIRIAAARLAARPYWSVDDLMTRLTDEGRLLDEFRYGGMDVRASIAMSYGDLPAATRRLFRLLGTLPVRDFPSWVSAPLLDATAGDANEALEQLVDAGLVQVVIGPEGRRNRVHHLVQVFARERLVAEEPAAERGAALRRLLGCLLHLTETAHRSEYGGDFTVLHSAAPRWRLDDVTESALLARPLKWGAEERELLVGAVGQAAEAGFADHAWDLAISTVFLFEHGMFFGEWRDTHEVALESARRHGNRMGEAAMLYSLGALCIARHQYREAVANLESASAIFTDLESAHGLGLTLRNLAFVDRTQDRPEAATTKYSQALGLLQRVGDRAGEAHVLHGLARVGLDLERYADARDLAERAAEISRETGNRRGEAQAAAALGDIHLAGDALDQARTQYLRALESVRATRDPVGEVYCGFGLGVVAMRQGDLDTARTVLSSSLDVARAIGEESAAARILLALGELRLGEGRPEAARPELEEAMRIFTRLDAVRWRSEALELLEQIERPERPERHERIEP